MSVLVGLVVVLASVPAPRADEGMWTFDNPPRAQWKERYGFEPADAWLDHLRLSSVRIVDGPGGGTGAFVSRDGLLLTNQHVAAGQLQKSSTAGHDLVRDGFFARTRADELKCPDLEALVLVSYEDVTERVHAAARPGASDGDAAAARRAAIAAIEAASVNSTELRSSVVTLYSGGEYWLHRYKRYTDIRLVFAPEEQIAYFGGDYDNFTFPRHDFDVAFLRVYENGRPATIEHYLQWSATGPSDGEFVVLSGVPGATDRLLTLTQVRFQRDVGNPLQRKVWESRRATLETYAKTGPEAARRAGAAIRSLENSLKRLVGQQQGLENPRVFAKKEEQEQALRAAVSGNPFWRTQYSGAWDRIDTAYRGFGGAAPRVLDFGGVAPRQRGFAPGALREEIGRPDASRLGRSGIRAAGLRFTLLSRRPCISISSVLAAGWKRRRERSAPAIRS